MIEFVMSIGIRVQFGAVATEKAFLPGICIHYGGLLIDPATLKYPGDILHEAAHLAVSTPENRKLLDGIIDDKDGMGPAEEMMAIAWSYAAARHLNIDPLIVFHEHGYKGGGASIAENFSQGHYFGVPMLQWTGLTHDEKNARENGTVAFPAMLRWLRE